MSLNITIIDRQSGRGQTPHLTSSTFPGGEVHVNLDIGLSFPDNAEYVVKAKLRSSDDIMRLMLVSDILRRRFPRSARRVLAMPYIPYARQDRACAPGDAVSVKVFAELINSLGYDAVEVYDPHSDVATALINNCRSVHAATLIREFRQLADVIRSNPIHFVSPDAGANKKVAEIAKAFDHPSFIRADKTRDCTTGKITGTQVFVDSLLGRDCLIFDDICDGGRTFIELGKALKEKGAGRVLLYVTHGILSKGTSVFRGAIDEIYIRNPLFDPAVLSLDPLDPAIFVYPSLWDDIHV